MTIQEDLYFKAYYSALVELFEYSNITNISDLTDPVKKDLLLKLAATRQDEIPIFSLTLYELIEPDVDKADRETAINEILEQLEKKYSLIINEDLEAARELEKEGFLNAEELEKEIDRLYPVCRFGFDVRLREDQEKEMELLRKIIAHKVKTINEIFKPFNKNEHVYNEKTINNFIKPLSEKTG